MELAACELPGSAPTLACEPTYTTPVVCPEIRVYSMPPQHATRELGLVPLVPESPSWPPPHAAYPAHHIIPHISTMLADRRLPSPNGGDSILVV